MANDILGTDPRFGLTGNATREKSMNTLMTLLDPQKGQVSVLPRLEQTKQAEMVGRMQEASTRETAASAGLFGSRALGQVEDAIGAQTSQQIAQADLGEMQRQEDQDRLALGAYLQGVVNPNAQARALNQEEEQLREQLSRLKSQKRLQKAMGVAQTIAGIVLVATGAGAPAGAMMIAGGVGAYAAAS